MALQIGQAEENGYRWLMPVSLSILQVGLSAAKQAEEDNQALQQIAALREAITPKNVLPFARKR